MELKQYQIVIVNLDPTQGSEIKKTRPCVIISPNEMNRHLKTVTIAPLTISKTNYPTRVNVLFQNKMGKIVLDQVRTIDKARIVKAATFLSKKEIELTKQIIYETFVR